MWQSVTWTLISRSRWEHLPLHADFKQVPRWPSAGTWHLFVSARKISLPAWHLKPCNRDEGKEMNYSNFLLLPFKGWPWESHCCVWRTAWRPWKHRGAERRLARASAQVRTDGLCGVLCILTVLCKTWLGWWCTLTLRIINIDQILVRYVVYTSKLENSDGRVSYPMCFIFSSPKYDDCWCKCTIEAQHQTIFDNVLPSLFIPNFCNLLTDCCSRGCKPEMNMMYAGSKLALVNKVRLHVVHLR